MLEAASDGNPPWRRRRRWDLCLQGKTEQTKRQRGREWDRSQHVWFGEVPLCDCPLFPLASLQTWDLWSQPCSCGYGAGWERVAWCMWGCPGVKKELEQRTRTAGQSSGKCGMGEMLGDLSSGAGQRRAVGCSLGGNSGRRGAEC